LYIRDEAPLEATYQAFLNALNFLRRSIGADDDLFFRIIETVESMKEFLLRALFVCKKLNIVNEKDIYITIFCLEILSTVILNGADEYIGELLVTYLARLSWSIAVPQ
jgi:hypothetical protein